MNQIPDAWFVRFPDARVMRANSTRSVRHHIEAGTIPASSWARRSPLDDWTPLHRLAAFADLLAEHGSSRREPRERPLDSSESSTRLGSNMQLQAIGIRGLATELGNSLDSTLSRNKLVVACYTGFFLGLIWMMAENLNYRLDWPVALWAMFAAGIIALLVAACSIVLLTQFTFIELSELRQAKWKETRRDLWRFGTRLSICLLVVIGVLGTLLYLVHWFPARLQNPPADWQFPGHDRVALAAIVLQILLRLILFPLLIFALLLGPIVVVEETSVLRCLAQWGNMIRRHWPRLFVFESLVLAVALLIALPFVATVLFAGANAPVEGTAGLVTRSTLCVLVGLAATPAIAYLAVANVFIYLHLRYEQPPVR